MQVTVRFFSVLPQFRWRKPWGCPGASQLSYPSTNPTRRLADRRLFIVPPSHKGTIIHLQASRAVGSLVVRASDSRPARCHQYPRVHTEYVLVKSVGPKVLWAESRVQGSG
ncbi:hypothetical protein TNCV_354981 [Trichonephila clavipes]|uniref:Uncharacterized protein n=1 Tax=Trichonephila clavipes TaxID=2585209 RepID=A0A8X6W0T9_TRICX|nr:hypothetical protein TNCV_354981 [Trichonephila clavipes]